MFTIIAFNMLPLLIAFVIGVATGWWIWARYAVDSSASASASASASGAATAPAPFVAPPVQPAPVASAAPIVTAQPVVTAPVVDPAMAPAPVIAKAEPVLAEPTPVVAAAALTPLGLAAAVGAPDNLLQLKGVGPKLNALLISLGITRFDQIAAWGDVDIAKVDGHLGSFKGRIVRDGWIEQAGLLSAGQIAAFEAKFGKLDSENA